jgi:hypothetical protein
MSELVLKVGNGCLHGIANDIPQPGKILTIYDGTTVIGIFPLDKPFYHIETNEDGEEVEAPGLILDVVFQHELRIVSDGQDIACWWYE